MPTFSAPAKIILFGEHAVVYGQPAIAVPFSSLRATAVVEPNSPTRQGLRIIVQQMKQTVQVDDADHILARIARTILEYLHAEAPDVTITLRSSIPVASGLGSGAAIAAVMGRALSASTNRPLDNDQLNAIVYEIEKLHHGTPSGIDNTVIVYEQPVYFIRNQPVQRLSIAQPLHLVIADTGHNAPTKLAVGDVRRLYETEPARVQPVLENIGRLVEQARRIMESGQPDVLGPLMNQNHGLLQALTVSSPDLDRLVETAVQAGALGAKLSGGGRGGNMIALVKPDQAFQVEKALRQAGAVRVYHTTAGA
jgi:mevalonate kinase